MLQSGFTKQLVEADVLLFIKPERVLVAWCFMLPVNPVCLFWVGIHDIG